MEYTVKSNQLNIVQIKIQAYSQTHGPTDANTIQQMNHDYEYEKSNSIAIETTEKKRVSITLEA